MRLERALCNDCKEKNRLSAMHLDCINELSRRQINRLLRQEDCSNLWPIRNKFNATERAVRRLQRLQRQGLIVNDGLEYYFTLENIISEIVNQEV